MASNVIVNMNPARLNAAIARANRASFKVAQADAKAGLHNKSKSNVQLRVVSNVEAHMIPKGLATVFEKGRQGGYEILPSGVLGLRRSYSRTKGATFRVRLRGGAAYGGSGQFIGFNNTPGTDSGTGVRRGPIQGGPMAPRPALKPAAFRWTKGGYQATARQMLGASGFRAA